MFFCRENGIYLKKRMNYLWKEFFRKTIHLCTAFVPLFLHVAKVPVLALLALTGIFYCVAERMRFLGHEIPVVSVVTATAARKRDENRFVLGPVTLVCGIILAAVLWDEQCAAMGILSLAFGDGCASLAGKCFGKVKIPFSGGKTACGSLACFLAIYVATFCVAKNTFLALVLALLGALVEVLPLKDFDNLLIPVLIGGAASALRSLPQIQLVH